MNKKELELKVASLEKQVEKLTTEKALIQSKLNRRDKPYKQHHYDVSEKENG